MNIWGFLLDVLYNEYKKRNNNGKLVGEVKKTNKPKQKYELYGAEEVYFSVGFKVGAFLQYLFPNTFEDSKSAEKFYFEYFVKKAKEYNESEKLYNNKFSFSCSVVKDYISGYYAWQNHTDCSAGKTEHFVLPTHKNIKNEQLKKEIKKLYKENLEHLQEIDFAIKGESFEEAWWYSPEDVFFSVYGIKFHKASDHSGFFPNGFYFPIETLLKILRISNAYALDKDEQQELIKDLEFWEREKDYNYEIDFKENKIKVENKFVVVFAYPKYFYKASESKMLQYKDYDINVFY